MHREAKVARCAAAQHGVVAAWQILERGFSRIEISRRVAQGRLHRLHTGVYAVGHSGVTRAGRWMAAVLATGPDAVLSHRDLAALHEIVDFTSGAIEVTLPRLGSRVRPGIRIHRTRRLGDDERTVVRGIPATTVERLMIDLAATISRRHLRRAYLEARRKDLIDLDRLDHALANSHGRRGIRSLRRICADDSDGFVRARSPLEVDFLRFCRQERIPEPQVNVWVGGYLVDAYWPDAALVVELDSWEYHRDRDAFERDRERITELRALGITVMPITHRRLARSRPRVASLIRRAVSTPPEERERRR